MTDPITVDDYKLVSDEFFQKYDFVKERLQLGAKAEDVNAKLLVSTSDSAATTSVSATYAQSGTTITITKSNHGYSVGSNIEITFSTGTAITGNYEIITVPDLNTFTVRD